MQADADAESRVDTTDRPFVGDSARRLAHMLPGTWELEMGNLQLPESDARQCLAWAWSGPGSPLRTATASHCLREIPAAAILSDGAGRMLVVTGRPWDGAVLVGAIATTPEFLSLDVRQPASIAAPTIPAALSQVTARLLPYYDRALVQGHRLMLDTALDHMRQARAGTDQPGLLPLAVALRQHAPYLIRHLRGPGAQPLSGQSAAFLDRAEETLASDVPADERETAELLERLLDDGTGLAGMVDALSPHLADEPASPRAVPGLPAGPPARPAGPRPL